MTAFSPRSIAARMTSRIASSQGGDPRHSMAPRAQFFDVRRRRKIIPSKNFQPNWLARSFPR